MMAAWSEQQARDELMDYFIGTDPLEIVLHRPVWAETAAGGRTIDHTDVLAGQRFMVYPFKRRLTQEYIFNPQTFGEDRVEKIPYILIFNRDHNIDLDDYFDPSIDTAPMTERLLPGRYEVSFISARLWDRGQAGLLYRG